jgi:hypothetical protein
VTAGREAIDAFLACPVLRRTPIDWFRLCSQSEWVLDNLITPVGAIPQMIFPLPLLLLPLVTAHREQIFQGPKYNLLDPTLVREIDQIRQDWGIHGAAIAVVRRRDDGGWMEDSFGIGVADGQGNKVTSDVSVDNPASSLRTLTMLPTDAIWHRFEFKTLHSDRNRPHHSKRNTNSGARR